MTDVPRRLPPSAPDRLRTIADHTAGGSLRGATAWGKRTGGDSRGGSGGRAASFVLVFHGDDSDVLRPSAAIVFWIGAAIPSNAQPYDFWYPANA